MSCFSRETTIRNVAIYANEKTITRLCFGKYPDDAAEDAETEIIKVAFIQLSEYLNMLY